MLCIGPRHSPHFPFNSSFVVYCLHRFHRPDVGRIHLAEVHLLVTPCYASSQWTDEVEIEWRGGRMWWQLSVLVANTTGDEQWWRDPVPTGDHFAALNSCKVRHIQRWLWLPYHRINCQSQNGTSTHSFSITSTVVLDTTIKKNLGLLNFSRYNKNND